jgi:signal transduction histidine kinase
MKDNTKLIFDSLPGCYLILLPDFPRFTIYDANQAYLKATEKTEEIIGKPLFEVFPDNPGDPEPTAVKNLTASLMAVLKTNRKHQMPIQRYDIRAGDGNTFQMHYWKPVNLPVHDSSGKIVFIIHCVEDVTKLLNVGSYLKKRYQDVQRQVSEVVVSTQEIERMGISRELHDNVLQLLNTSRLYMERALETNPPNETLASAGVEMVTTAMDELRKIATAAIQPSGDEETLNTLVERVLSHVIFLGHIVITREIEIPDELVIEPQIKMAIVRIMQEHLGNVVKHSMARNLWITLSQESGRLKLVIKDDGVGFNVDEKLVGLGLQNIRARVAMLNGNVNIQSSPGNGCHIEVTIPL